MNAGGIIFVVMYYVRRAERVFPFIFFSLFSFAFHNFMYSIYITTNECFFFGAAPAFDLMLPLKRFLIRFSNLAPNKFYGTTAIRIEFRMRTCLMFLSASFQVFCEACVVGAIGTLEYVNCIWHKDYPGYSRFVYVTHPSRSWLRSAR